MTIRCYYDSKWANAFRRKKAEEFLLSEHNFLHCQNHSSQQVYISRLLHGNSFLEGFFSFVQYGFQEMRAFIIVYLNMHAIKYK